MSFCFLFNFRTHELSFTGPSTIELALAISSGYRYCILYYTYYLSNLKYCPIAIAFPNLTMYLKEL